MLLKDKKNNELSTVTIVLLRDEAQELMDSLNSMLTRAESSHEHIASADFKKEITVYVEKKI